MIEQANSAFGAVEETPADGASRPVLLREAREAAGLHIAALAAALKVPVKKMEALEAGRYDELPDMTFARALAASACRHLKVDPTRILEQIPHGAQPPLGDSPQTINAPYKGAAEAAPNHAGGWLTRPAVLGAAALLLGALVIVFLPSGPIGEPSTDGVPGAAPAADGEGLAPVPVVAPLAAPAASGVVDAPDAAASAPQPLVPAAVPPATTTPAVTATGTTTVSPAAASPTAGNATASVAGTGLLSIVATGDAWIEVVNGAGSVVAQRMLKAGDALDFSSAPPYAVVIGRADAARVTVRGQPFDIAPYARNSVARFEVK
jgi:cytoskeleton protein RodZ